MLSLFLSPCCKLSIHLAKVFAFFHFFCGDDIIYLAKILTKAGLSGKHSAHNAKIIALAQILCLHMSYNYALACWTRASYPTNAYSTFQKAPILKKRLTALYKKSIDYY
jgi:hypothetical protein